ncbi:MAG: hypothetical protein ABTQ32_21595 [Myxococcaceae bacterium]
MDDWMQCQTCGLKYRARPDGCPRCAKTAAEQPEPSLAEQIPPSPVYEPPRYQPADGALITAYSSGEAAPPPFRLPWYLLGGTAVLLLLGALIGPIRGGVGVVLMGAGGLLSAAAGLWTLIVAWGLGIGWFVGAAVFPIVGLIALFRADNLRPLALNVTALLMLGSGAGLASQVQSHVVTQVLQDAATRDQTREEYIADCKGRGRDAFLCGCVAAVLYDELGAEVRERFNQGKETAADKQLLESSVKRNCR